MTYKISSELSCAAALILLYLLHCCFSVSFMPFLFGIMRIIILELWIDANHLHPKRKSPPCGSRQHARKQLFLCNRVKQLVRIIGGSVPFGEMEPIPTFRVEWPRLKAKSEANGHLPPVFGPGPLWKCLIPPRYPATYMISFSKLMTSQHVPV